MAIGNKKLAQNTGPLGTPGGVGGAIEGSTDDNTATPPETSESNPNAFQQAVTDHRSELGSTPLGTLLGVSARGPVAKNKDMYHLVGTLISNGFNVNLDASEDGIAAWKDNNRLIAISGKQKLSGAPKGHPLANKASKPSPQPPSSLPLNGVLYQSFDIKTEEMPEEIAKKVSNDEMVTSTDFPLTAEGSIVTDSITIPSLSENAYSHFEDVHQPNVGPIPLTAQLEHISKQQQELAFGDLHELFDLKPGPDLDALLEPKRHWKINRENNQLIAELSVQLGSDSEPVHLSQKMIWNSVEGGYQPYKASSVVHTQDYKGKAEIYKDPANSSLELFHSEDHYK